MIIQKRFPKDGTAFLWSCIPSVSFIAQNFRKKHITEVILNTSSLEKLFTLETFC